MIQFLRCAKIGLVLISFFVTASFARPAFCAEKPCSESTKEHKEKDISKLRKAVEAATTAGDSAAMVKLALCDFHIGVSESDVGGFRRASGVMPAIAKALKGTKWKSKAQDYGGYLMVESKSPSQKYVLNFKKDEKGMWSWLGLNGVTSEDVEPFLKNSYQLYGGAEED